MDTKLAIFTLNNNNCELDSLYLKASVVRVRFNRVNLSLDYSFIGLNHWAQIIPQSGLSQS